MTTNNNNGTSCYFCDELIPVDEAKEFTTRENWNIKTEYCCESCADSNLIECDDCGELFTDELIFIDPSNTSYCESCMSEYYSCEDCGRFVHERDVEEIDGYYYCESCAEDNRTYIRNYSFKPLPEFHGNGVKFFGVELETDLGDNRDSYARELYESSRDENLYYLKEDSSLDDGVEVVTHPCTLEYHLSQFPWQEITNIAKEYEFKSHDAETCGLHVHISRAAFGEGEEEQEKNIAKLLFLVNNNWEDMVKLSRRTE